VAVSRKQENEGELRGFPVRQIDEFAGARDQTLVIVAVMPRLASEMSRYVRELGFQKVLTAQEISRRLYEEIWKDPICERKIVLSSFAGGGFGAGFLMMALVSRYLADIHLVFQDVLTAFGITVGLGSGILFLCYFTEGRRMECS